MIAISALVSRRVSSGNEGDASTLTDVRPRSTVIYKRCGRSIVSSMYDTTVSVQFYTMSTLYKERKPQNKMFSPRPSCPFS